MYLPSDQKEWYELGRADVIAIIEELNAHVKSVYGIDSLLEWVPRWRSVFRRRMKHSFSLSSEAKLQVENVDCQQLTFYPKKSELYRFACVIDQIDELAGYERLAYLFAIRAPTNDWTLLDWTSSTIHALNERFALDLSQLSRKNDSESGDFKPDPKLLREQARDYLGFFCSFFGSEDANNTIAPSLIPSTLDDFGLKNSLQSLQEIADKRKLQIFSPSKKDVNESDQFDLPAIKSKENKHDVAGRAVANSNDADKKSIDKIIVDEFKKRNDSNHPSHDEQKCESSQSGKGIYCFKDVLVWYRNDLFSAQFSVTSEGQVDRDTYKPIPGATNLTMPRWLARNVYSASIPVPLLCREQKREEIMAQELLARIKQRIELPTDRMMPIRLRGLRILDAIKLSGKFSRPVHLENIEFMDEVILDDAIFEHSLKLINCHFLGQLSARNITIKSAFRLDDSYFYGAINKGFSKSGISVDEKALTTLDLQSLDAQGGVFADRVIVFGRVLAQWARIKGGMHARGLQVYFREKVDDASIELLDFSYMQIDGPLDLRGVPLTETAFDVQRTVIGGNAVMQGFCAYQAQLDGISIDGDLNLASCRITSTLTMSIIPYAKDFWRPYIKQGFHAEFAQIGMLDIRGCWIGESLRLTGLQLDDSLFTGLADRFRTRISGGIEISGAKIGGDIDLGGAEILGEFHFITGRCTRLLMDVEAWIEQKPDEVIPRICSTEVSGVLLQDLQIDAGVALAGIQVSFNKSGEKAGNYIARNFIAHGTRLRGGFRFWREDGRERLGHRFDQLLSQFRPQVTDKDKIKATFNLIKDEVIDQIRACIHGNLDLRGIHTGDSINLGRCRVKGSIRLENAHVGGNLRAFIEDDKRVCEVRVFEAEDFRADIAHIEGDVDLRGLKVNSLIALDLQVSGSILLACPEASKDGQSKGQYADITDTINLEGMHTAAQVVLSSKNLASKKNDATQPARINLARCNIGQLIIHDFDESGGQISFPHSVNLLAIKVGDWRLKKDRFSALLEKTKYFDADNYIDIEHRLARIGDKRLANEVYRAMKSRSNDRDDGSIESSIVWERFLRCFDRLLYWLRWDLLLDRLNWLFSGHGTVPALMVIWLIFWMFPVIWVLTDSRNVEFILTVSHEKKSGYPYSDGKKYDLEQDWNWEKAIGLSMSYAIPFYGSRPDVVRARLNGGTCLWGADSQTETENDSCDDLTFSPHGIAMFFSVIQFILWVMIAANLPTIVRRRS